MKIFENDKDYHIKYNTDNLLTDKLLATVLSISIETAGKILEQVNNNLSILHGLSFEELVKLDGVGEARAKKIMALNTLSGRIQRSQKLKDMQVTSSKAIGEYLISEFKGKEQENFILICLDTKNNIIKKKTLYTGGLSSCIVEPRDVFREAIKCSSARIIIAHNHPSGNPEPSQADFATTRRIEESGELMGIDLLDHIIVGDNRFVSMREEGGL